MALEFSCELKDGFLLGRIVGVLDYEAFFDHTRSILDATDAAGLGKVLIDIRGVQGVPSTIERWNYGKFVAEESFRHLAGGKVRRIRVAMLGHAPMIDPGKLAESVAVNRMAEVKATTLPAEAERWLGVKLDEGGDEESR